MRTDRIGRWGGIGVVLLGALGTYAMWSNFEPAKPRASDLGERVYIDRCWHVQELRSNAPEEARMFAGICEDAEIKYHDKHGRWYTRNGRPS